MGEITRQIHQTFRQAILDLIDIVACRAEKVRNNLRILAVNCHMLENLPCPLPNRSIGKQVRQRHLVGRLDPTRVLFWTVIRRSNPIRQETLPSSSRPFAPLLGRFLLQKSSDR